MKKDIYHPPGGILIWVVIFVETITFAMGILAYTYMRTKNVEVFNTSQLELNKGLATINTIVLLTGGFLMAMGIQDLKKGWNKRSAQWILGAIVTGIIFLFIKGSEYAVKIEHGHDLRENLFFTFYWLLTAFHFIHVFVAVIILTALYFNVKRGKYTKDDYFDVETGGAFWHMCDLIWLMLFPVLYLLH